MPTSRGTQFSLDWSAHTGKDEKSPEAQVVVCPKCQCRWMEAVQVYQYSEFHTVTISQKPAHTAGPFNLIRCARCGHLIEPHIQTGTRDSLRGQYDKMIANVMAPLPAEGGEKV